MKDKQSVSNWERNEQDPGARLFAIADACGVKAEWLLGYEDLPDELDARVACLSTMVLRLIRALDEALRPDASANGRP